MEKIFTNCTVVTRDNLLNGTVVIDDGKIVEVAEGRSHSPAVVDLEGDYLLPGLIELHTDNLEKNIQPRPGVIWPSILSATLAHDNQIAGAGITTVYDAIAVGGLRESSLRSRIFSDSIQAITHGSESGLFKADHYLHLRCEISDSEMERMLLDHGDNSRIRLVSIMDHTPGQRQWSDIAKWKLYHRDKKWSDEESDEIVRERKAMQERYAEHHRDLAIDFAHRRRIPLASHDDTTLGDIAQATDEGIGIAEFPTTLVAAENAKKQGMTTIMGAPNAVRGESHSGNISAKVLAEQRLLDGLSSDYVPTSLLLSAFILADSLEVPLNKSVAMVSANIADALNLNDRGQISKGRRADILRVRLHDKLPVLRQVWREGVQIS